MEVLAIEIRQEKKVIKTEKEELTLSLYADDMMLYVENSTDSTQKQLKLIDEFSKGEGYKIDIQKSVIFFILTIKYQKGKVKKKSLLKSHQKIK